jgi:hypothetical protein
LSGTRQSSSSEPRQISISGLRIDATQIMNLAAAVQGLPPGGLAGQVLKKRSDTNFDSYWADASGSPASVDGGTF